MKRVLECEWALCFLGSIDSLVSLILMWSSEWTISWMLESIVCATLDVQHFDHDLYQSISIHIVSVFEMVLKNKLFNFNTKCLNRSPQMDAIKLQYFILFLSFGVIRWLRLNQFFFFFFWLFSFIFFCYFRLWNFVVFLSHSLCFVSTKPLEVSIWFISNCYIITLEFILKANKFVAFIYLWGEKMKSF